MKKDLKLRILFIANSVSLYGANRSMLDLAIALKKFGQEIFFLFPQNGAITDEHIGVRRIIEKQGIIVSFLNYSITVHDISQKKSTERIFRKEMNKKCLPEMIERAMKWGIDIVHTNSLTHIVGAQLAKHINKPHVWHIRESLKNDYHLDYDSALLYRYYLRRTEQIICISNFVRQTHKSMLVGASVQVLYDGFNTDNYIINSGYKKDKDLFTIIICGVIQEGKGQLEAVRAIECLIHKHEIKNIRLQIVGDHVGEYSNRIVNYIRDNNLTDFIELIPFQDDLRELRKSADIALMCSRSEALGRVTIESMLSENLVIGANSAGTAEIIKDGVIGYLYKAGSEVDLCEKLYYVITHWNEQEKIIRQARNYAETNFEINGYAKKILDIYRQIYSNF